MPFYCWVKNQDIDQYFEYLEQRAKHNGLNPDTQMLVIWDDKYKTKDGTPLGKLYISDALSRLV